MADATTTTTTTTTTAPAATAGTNATSSTGEKNVVVFGGTGAQGSAFVRALSEYPGYKIFLLVRSEKPTPLKDLPGVTIVHSAEYGEHPALALRATHLKPGEVYGVFSVQGYIPEKQEITQGKNIARAAKEWGCHHFVYASANCGSEEINDGMHGKRAVEAEIEKQGFPLVTVLGDTDFMDNWLPHASYSHKLYRTVLWRKTFTPQQLGTKKIMLVSTRDIGRAGAKALNEGITGKLPLAGDSLTMNGIIETYEDCYGKKPDETMGLAATAVKYVSSAISGLSNFYKNYDSEFDVEVTRKVLPDVEDFKSFLQRTKEDQPTRRLSFTAGHRKSIDKNAERKASKDSAASH